GTTKLKITWLNTRALVASSTQAATSTAGVIVTSRRSQSGIRQSTKSCMMTCPAIVPTTELDRPEASREIMKIVAERPPNSGPSIRYASSIPTSDAEPGGLNVTAATH